MSEKTAHVFLICLWLGLVVGSCGDGGSSASESRDSRSSTGQSDTGPSRPSGSDLGDDALQLVFAPPPPDTVTALMSWPDFAVEVQDPSGDPVAFDESASIEVSRGSGTLSGRTVASLRTGRAEFRGISYDLTGPMAIDISAGDLAIRNYEITVVRREREPDDPEDLEPCAQGTSRCTSEREAALCLQEGLEHHIRCGPFELCVSGHCEDAGVCFPGSVLDCADESSINICAESGVDVEVEDCPAEAPYCVNSFGGCSATECSDGERRCAARSGSVQSCADGVWTTTVTCDVGELCRNAACVDLCADDGKYSYFGCEHYALDLDQWDGAEDVEFAVAIGNPNPEHIIATITSGAEGTVQSVEVEPFTSRLQTLPNLSLSSSGLSHDLYAIVTNGPATVHQFNPALNTGDCTNDAALLLPAHQAGHEYVVVGWQGGVSVVVVATSDDTVVTVVPTDDIFPGTGVPAIEAGSSQEIALQRGDVLVLMTNQTGPSDFRDLTGTTISANRPIVAHSVTECANIPTDRCCCDHLEHQLFPVEGWGQHYHLAPMEARPGIPDYLRIVSSQDGTELSVSPDPWEIDGAVLDRGEFLTLELDQPVELEASVPVSVAQFLASAHVLDGNSLGDPAFTLVIPVERYRSDYVLVTPALYDVNYLSLVYPEGADITLDGRPVSAAGAEAVGSSGYIHHLVSLGGSAAVPVPHLLVGSEPFTVQAFGLAFYASYAFPGGVSVSGE